MRRRRRAERGQTMVEFAIVANIAALLLLTIFQGGVAWYHRLALEEATREGARAAIVSVSGGSAGMISVAKTQVLSGAKGLDHTTLNTPGNILVTSQIPARATTCLQAWQPDCDVTVEVKNYPWKVGLGPIGFSGSLDVKTSMRIEGG